MLGTKLIDIFEQKPSEIKLSSFLKDKETFLEFALRLYVNFGRDVYDEFVNLVEDSKTVTEFAEKFFNQYMVVYFDVPSLFDYTVANSVKQINSLSEDSKKRLWNEMSSMNKLDIWDKASLNRIYAVRLMLNNEEVIRWGKINDKLQPKVLVADKCLQSIKEYIGSFPDYSNIQNIPVVVVYNVLKYLHTKWSLDEETFHYDPNNIAYISYIQTLCNDVFSNANIDSDKPYIFFVNALAVGNKDVMANVYQNFVIGKSESKRSVNSLPNPDSAFPVIKNPKQAELFLRYVYYELKLNFHPETGLEKYYNIGDTITTNSGIEITVTQTNINQFNENIKRCFEILGQEKVYDLCDSYLKDINGWNQNQTSPNIVDDIMQGPREVTIDDLDSFVSLLNKTWGITDKQAEQKGMFYTRWFNYEMGKKYCRITTGPYNRRGLGTAYCFIDLANGNIHKANGYKAPDKKHVRGNIFGENPLDGLTEYGTIYLR